MLGCRNYNKYSCNFYRNKYFGYQEKMYDRIVFFQTATILTLEW